MDLRNLRSFVADGERTGFAESIDFKVCHFVKPFVSGEMVASGNTVHARTPGVYKIFIINIVRHFTESLYGVRRASSKINCPMGLQNL
jgi:hypothetical protein